MGILIIRISHFNVPRSYLLHIVMKIMMNDADDRMYSSLNKVIYLLVIISYGGRED